MTEVKPGIYQHFKGKEYKIIGTALHSETREEYVVYIELYPPYDLNVRPKHLFLEEVDKPEYNWKGPRFKLIRELPGLWLTLI